ncbi:MAG: YgaP family membrane protein [Bacteroidota bacterium]
MKANMGVTDKTIRVLIAITVGILIYTNVISGTWAIVAGILSIIFVLTSMIGFCPLYAILGVKTCKSRN